MIIILHAFIDFITVLEYACDFLHVEQVTNITLF